MGERVYVSVGEPRVNPPPPPGPQPVEPLNYGDRTIPPEWMERGRGAVRWLGGWPQIAFAIGLGTTLASIAIGYSRIFEAGVWAFVGGVLMGIVLRVPLRRDW
jgi:hypothetical protein